jgi:hypothetical protein
MGFRASGNKLAAIVEEEMEDGDPEDRAADVEEGRTTWQER